MKHRLNGVFSISIFIILASVISPALAYENSQRDSYHNSACDTDFSIETQTACEQAILDTLEDQLKIHQETLLSILTKSEAFYQNKYQDAFYDNFEMPYQEVKEALIKSHIFWEQYISSECAVVHALSARGTAKNILELQCLQDYSEARTKLLQEYLKEIQLDAESLLQMP